METNLVTAYKSLALVLADPGVTAIAAGAGAEEIKKMMGQIKGALVEMANKRAAAEVDAMLAQ